MFLTSDSQITLPDKSVLNCSEIKLGENTINLGSKKINIIDARYLFLNNKQLSSLYKYENTKFVCTGSPQLNTEIIKRGLNE